MPRPADAPAAFRAAIWQGDTHALRLLARPAKALDARIRVHQNNVFFSLIQALADLYPRVRRFVGHEFFDLTARTFLTENHPTSPAMVRFGAAFPDFLSTVEPLAAHRYVADVARAELMWHQAYHAADAPPLRRDDLAGVSAAQWQNAKLALHPSARLLASRYALDVLWEMSDENPPEPAPTSVPGRAAHLLFVRPFADVEVRTLASPAFALLQALAQGRTVTEACDIAQAEDSEANPPAMLRDMIDGACFTAMEISEATQ